MQSDEFLQFCVNVLQQTFFGQLCVISTTYCEEFNVLNILQHCLGDFAAESANGYKCNTLVSLSLEYQKEVLLRVLEKN